MQIISSLRRIEFVKTMDNREISPERLNSRSELFDPLKAAILCRNRGDTNEAAWLIFLATHFGKHEIDGWRLCRDFYGAFGSRPEWTWSNVTNDLEAFAEWVLTELDQYLNDGIQRRFSNHRKYESKNPETLISVVFSYINLINTFRDHNGWLLRAQEVVGQHPHELFQFLYNSMSKVLRFGRLGKFDYLTMIGKLQLMPIEPGKAYIRDATGPTRGANLLFNGNATEYMNFEVLEDKLVSFGRNLNIGMQVVEDALCNWQKSPSQFVYFRG